MRASRDQPFSLEPENRKLTLSVFAGKTYVFYFDDFAVTIGLLKQGVFRFGVGMNEANALMGGGGLTALLGAQQQVEMVRPFQIYYSRSGLC